MPVNENMDNNATIALNVIDGLDLGVPTEVQKLLAPVYEAFPSLANTIWGIPYANLIAAILVFFFFLLLRRFFSSVIVVSLQQLAKKTSNYYDDKIISALKGPLGFIFILIGLHLFFLLIFKETDVIKHILETLVVYAVFWAILSIIEAMRGVVYD